MKYLVVAFIESELRIVGKFSDYYEARAVQMEHDDASIYLLQL